MATYEYILNFRVTVSVDDASAAAVDAAVADGTLDQGYTTDYHGKGTAAYISSILADWMGEVAEESIAAEVSSSIEYDVHGTRPRVGADVRALLVQFSR